MIEPVYETTEDTDPQSTVTYHTDGHMVDHSSESVEDKEINHNIILNTFINVRSCFSCFVLEMEKNVTLYVKAWAI